MKTDDRWSQRHPLCTCPEPTWDAVTGEAGAPDLDACRARAFGGVNPHPVLTADDLRAVIANLRERLSRPYEPDPIYVRRPI